MGKRFRKSIKVAPGVKVNLGKKSVGVSVGGKHDGNELGIEIPPNISTADASAMISRMEDDDAPDDILAEEEWDAACQAGVVISALCGHTFYNSAMKNAKQVK